jgi:hypothetical protein
MWYVILFVGLVITLFAFMMGVGWYFDKISKSKK